jgi:hypothetical protein
MSIEKLFHYIKENLHGRLKAPYVSQDYTLDAQEKLYAGINIALSNADKNLLKNRLLMFSMP